MEYTELNLKDQLAYKLVSIQKRHLPTPKDYRDDATAKALLDLYDWDADKVASIIRMVDDDIAKEAQELKAKRERSARILDELADEIIANGTASLILAD